MLIGKDTSTSAALTQMTDDWLRDIDHTMIEGAVLLDFSAAFDIIDQSAAGKTYVLWLYTPLAIMWIKSYLSNRTHRVFFNGSLSNIIQLESRIPRVAV